MKMRIGLMLLSFSCYNDAKVLDTKPLKGNYLDNEDVLGKEYKEDNADIRELILVEDNRIFAVDGEPFNFSIALNSIESRGVEVHWECDNSYVVPGEGHSNSLLLTSDNFNQTFQLQSSLYGIFKLRLFSVDNENRKVYFEQEVELMIKRLDSSTTKKLILMIGVLVGIALIFMGLELDLNIVIKTVKRPYGPCIGMICQFILMPVFSYLLGYLLLTTTYERLGLLLIGCSPGGANSNFWTAMFNGDVNLSVTMTFISSIASFAFTTMWIYLLGSPMVGKTVEIPYVQLTVSLASFVLPLLIGVAVKYKFPKVAEKIGKLSRPFFLTCLIIFPCVGLANNYHFFYLCTWRTVVSGAALGLLGFSFGAGLAWLCRQDRAQIIAISLETAIQNGGIAFVVLSLTFESPVSDMANIPIIGFFLCSTGPIIFVFYGAYVLVQKIRRCYEFKKVDQEEPASSS